MAVTQTTRTGIGALKLTGGKPAASASRTRLNTVNLGVRELTRRTKATRWIISLNPLMDIINCKMSKLGLGQPRLEVGPQWLPRERFEDSGGDRIRKGAVWFVGGRNCGFHADFCAGGQLHIEAWVGGDRRISTWIAGDVTEATLKRDLGVCLAAAGLTDLARTEEVRDQIFSRTARN